MKGFQQILHWLLFALGEKQDELSREEELVHQSSHKTFELNQ